MARLAERLYSGMFSHVLYLTLFLLVSCSKGPRTGDVSGFIRTSTLSGNISNLSSFGVASAEEFRIYALNTEGRAAYANINTNGSFSLSVPANSLYLFYVLQDSDGDGSFDNHIGTFDSVAGGALDLVPVYSDDLDIGTFALPTSFDLIDLTSNPAIGRDMDGDGVLDDVDDDINGNGLADTDDLLVLDYDDDNIPNPIDIDRDGDGTNNPNDPNQFDDSPSPLIYEQDSDGDGIIDSLDIEPTSLYGNLKIIYVSGRITYIPPGEALTAVAVSTKGHFVRSAVDEQGNFSIPVREGSLFVVYFMNGNVTTGGQNLSEFRGVIDPIAGGMPNGIAIGSSNLDLGNLTLPSNPLSRALNLNINIMASRDADRDGIRDSIDTDRDGNGITDATEILKLNFDGDLFPNIIDTDDDNDGILDGLDTDRDGDSLTDPVDTDSDGVGDSSDIDFDNDGQLDGTNPTLIETPDLDAPIISTFPSSSDYIRFSNIEPYRIRVEWNFARDNATSTELLEYRVIKAQLVPSNSSLDTAPEVLQQIDTAAEIMSIDPLVPSTIPEGVSIVQDWTPNIKQVDATGLIYPELYYFAVVVLDEAGNATLYTPRSQSTEDLVAPTPGAAIVTNSPVPGPDNITVSWGAATDNIVGGVLSYKLVTASTTAEIDTVDKADAQANLLPDWTTGVTSFNVTGLEQRSTHAFAVLVKDEADNIALYTPATGTTTDIMAPEPQDGPYFSEVTDTTARISWDAAEDNTYDASTLQYKVVYSLLADGSDIDSITEANTTTNITLNWTTNVTTTTVSGLSQSNDYSFAILVRDPSGNVALYLPQGFTTINSNAPTVSGVIRFPAKTATTVDIEWDEAGDDITDVNLLQYKVVRASTASAIDTIAEADGIGVDVVEPWTTDIQFAQATGLTSGDRYFFAVLVKDDANNINIYSPQSVVTTDTLAPNLGVGSIQFAGTTTSQTTVSWPAANDTTTAPASLQYKLVRSLIADNVDDIIAAEALTGADVVMNWTNNTLTQVSSGLNDAETYYYAVLVRDQALNVSIYPYQSVTTLDGTGPEVISPDDNITFDTPLETQVTLRWGEATDAVDTDPATLQYKIVRGTTSAAIDSIAEVEAASGANLISNWQASTNFTPTGISPDLEYSFTVSGLTHSTSYFFAVAVKDVRGNISLYTPQSVTTSAPANSAPTPGTGIVSSGTSDTATVLTWGVATDDLTAQTSLQYKVMRGPGDSTLDSSPDPITAIEAGWTTVSNWTTNLLSQTALGLTASTTYKFAVIVRDAAGLKSLYTTRTVTTTARQYYIFVSNTTAGKFTMAQADALCNSSATGALAGKTYKAILSNGTSGTRRVGQADWPLAAGRTYKDRNGLSIGTTNGSGIFAFPLTRVLDPNFTAATFVWTGLNADWTSNSTNCNGWTSNKNNTTGVVGSPASTSSTSIFITGSAGIKKCGASNRLYCAEQ